MSRIRVFVGHFGSGKTEIAINYAMKLLEQGRRVAIVDLDIVNPYFCVRNVKDFIQGKGIKVISSKTSLMNAELMVVPAEVKSIFNDKSYEVIIDVGGDGAGALVLGQYYKYFCEEDYDLYFVVNNNRPFTLNSIDTEEYIRSIERASRLKVKYLISNSNLSYETEEDQVLEGEGVVQELSERTGIPFRYTVCRRDLYNKLKLKTKGKLFPIDIYMKKPWED